jgi:hypothetical protein
MRHFNLKFMSKQTSLVTFKGRMGNVAFFKKNGEDRARMVGEGITKERFQNDPKLERVRENVREMTALSVTVKSIRSALRPVTKFLSNTLGGRLRKVLRIINKRSDGVRGQRSVLLSQNRSLLAGMELNNVQDFATTFGVRYTIENPTRTSVTLTVAAAPPDLIKAPVYATHFRILQCIGTVADTVFDPEAKKYFPQHPELDGLSELSYSDYLPARGAEPLNISLTTTLSQEIPAEVSVVHCLAIIFYDKVGADYYPLTDGGAAKLLNVW